MPDSRDPADRDEIGCTYDADDGIWIATEDRRGCWASGATSDEALAALVPICRDWDATFGASS